jgi:hypothetical protein
MEQLLQRLVRQAYLFDDPAAYEAGVRDAIGAVEAEHAADDRERVARSRRHHPAAGARLALHAVEDSVA